MVTGRGQHLEACIGQVRTPPLFYLPPHADDPHHLPQGTMNQHLPHVHEQLLVGCIAGASSDNGDEGDNECNPAPSTTTEMTRPQHQTPPLRATACRE